MRSNILNHKFCRNNRGFTLMELVIVMTIIAILSTIAIPIYITHVRRAKEVVLLQDLQEMRHAIDKYIADKEKAPSSLSELVSAGYLRMIPENPLTKSAEDWSPIMEKAPTKPGAPIGIEDVKCPENLGTGSDNRAYTDY